MRAIAAFVFTAGLALAQLDSNTITITASRTISSAPDQVNFIVQVSTGTDANLTDALAIVRPIGLTASDLSSVDSYTTYDSKGRANGTALRWSFTVNAPVSALKDPAAKLQAFAQNAQGVSISVSGSQSSSQSSCPTNDLIADARTQAQLLASAVGVTVGPILGISTPVLGIGAVVPVAAFRSGDFSGSAGFASFLLGVPYATQPVAQTCSLTLKFGLLRYQ
jgi:uncharacterized protein YggE